RVHGDAKWTGLNRQRSGEALHRGLGRAVVDVLGPAPWRAHQRGDRDDAASALSNHPGQDRSGTSPNATEVRLHHLTPFTISDIDEWSAARDTRVGDQSVDLSEAPNQGGYATVNAPRVRNVHDCGGDLGPQVQAELGRLL